MVANIRSGATPGGALRYNKEKVDKDEAAVLFWQKMLEPFDKHGRLDIDTVFRINLAGRIYGVTFIDHNAGIVANGSMLGKEFFANTFNKLYPVLKNDKQVAEQQYSEQKYEPRNLTVNPLTGIVDAILNLADVRAFEEQQRQIQRRKKRRFHK